MLVQETSNPREVQPAEDFTVRLDQRWCDCGKFQKVHMPCSHVIVACMHSHHEYKAYIDPMYKFESILNVCK